MANERAESKTVVSVKDWMEGPRPFSLRCGSAMIMQMPITAKTASNSISVKPSPRECFRWLPTNRGSLIARSK